MRNMFHFAINVGLWKNLTKNKKLLKISLLFFLYMIYLGISIKKEGMNMIDKKKLGTLENVVKNVLENDPTTRDDNFKLYAKVVMRVCHINNSHSFLDVMFNHTNYDLPPMESITRTRRLVVTKHPELDSTKTVKEFRQEQEKEYIEYSKEV